MSPELLLIVATALFLATAIVLLGFVAHGAGTIPQRLARFLTVVLLVSAWLAMAGAFGVLVS